jgi:hypothetical protein
MDIDYILIREGKRCQMEIEKRSDERKKSLFL